MLKILIAEDDRELRQLFQHVLIKNGYTVKGVGNGQEALDALDADYFDLIILDIMMPVMDGYEFVRHLREGGSTTPVLMITAKDAFDDMRQGFLSGTDDYMVKPVNVNEMVLRVGALLRRAQMINERRQTIGDTTLECDSLTVTTAGESTVLPQKEFMLLCKMVSYSDIFHRNLQSTKSYQNSIVRTRTIAKIVYMKFHRSGLKINTHNSTNISYSHILSYLNIK